MAILSVSVILLSIATFCLETLPQFKQYRLVRHHLPESITTTNAAVYNDSAVTSLVYSADLVEIVEEDDTPAFDDPLFVIETICVVWYISSVLVQLCVVWFIVDDVDNMCVYFTTQRQIRATTTTNRQRKKERKKNRHR